MKRNIFKHAHLLMPTLAGIKKDNMNRLVIIGNGFDLAHDLKNEGKLNKNQVVVTVMAGLDNGNIEDMELLQNEYYENKDNLIYSFMWLQSDIGDIVKSIIRDNKIKRFESYVNTVNDLNALCEFLELDLVECINKAWNEIKDRKGYLNEEGIFIKEEDL